MKMLQDGTNDPFARVYLLNVHVEEALTQLDILRVEARRVAVFSMGGAPNYVATNAVYNFYSRLTTALDTSVKVLLPEQDWVNFYYFEKAPKKAKGWSTKLEKDVCSALEPKFKVVDEFCIHAADDKFFKPRDFWNVVKHKQYGIVQGDVGKTTVTFRIGNLYKDIIPSAESWFAVVKAWIDEVKQHAPR